MELNQEFWSDRYKNEDTGWNIGFASTPIVAYFLNHEHKTDRILIPGAGHAHEAEWLWQRGYKNVFVLDLSLNALSKIKERCPNFPNEQLIHGDFFDHQGEYDCIVEQTFFCAIAPELRSRYVAKMKALLHSNGVLIGLLFDAPLNKNKPPFGGDATEYQNLFKTWKNCSFTPCSNSIIPRQGRELFICLKP